MKRTDIKSFLLPLSLAIVVSLITSKGRCQSIQSGFYAIIAGGIHKDYEIRHEQHQLLERLKTTLLRDFGIQGGSLQIFSEPVTGDIQVNGTATAENLKTAFMHVAKRIQPEDRFLFYYMGQANAIQEDLRINLPGQDITHSELAAHLGEIHAATSVIIMDCPNAGLAIEQLTGPNRIVIASCRSDQPYSTHFSKYFIPALDNPNSDLNKDQRISLLEVFQSAAMSIDELYRKEDYMRTENALLEDNGDGIPSQHPWLYKEEEVDGERAARALLRAF